MIRKYCSTCKTETYFSSAGRCSNCINIYKQNEYNKQKDIFTSLSTDDKLIYIFDKIFELQNKTNITDVYF